MSEKKYMVPEGMLQAVYKEKYPCSVRSSEMEKHLEAALRWLAENPSIPSADWVHEKVTSIHDSLLIQTIIVRMIAEWQREMFLAAEPEYPADVLELLRTHPKQAADVIVAAYRLGQKAGSK